MDTLLFFGDFDLFVIRTTGRGDLFSLSSSSVEMVSAPVGDSTGWCFALGFFLLLEEVFVFLTAGFFGEAAFFFLDGLNDSLATASRDGEVLVDDVVVDAPEFDDATVDN
jgi:hypothetical protein